MLPLHLSRSASLDIGTKTTTDHCRQFYSLSKKHHPDLNPNDREASNRFVRISEAYAVLGNLAKRERYDRDTRSSSGGPPHVNQGSHSSSGPYGSRPASGLSRRRTQFRGPPPSFYRSGGWGPQGTKRAPQPGSSATSSSAAPGMKSAESGASNISGGIRLGGHWSNKVPHFDHEGHYRTQEQQELRRMKRVREYSDHHDSGGSALINFAVIGGVISLAYLIISAPFEYGKIGSRNKNGL